MCLPNIDTHIIDQERGRDGWILAQFAAVHKNAKRKRGLYPTILTSLDLDLKDFLYDIPRLHVALCFYLLLQSIF